MAVDMADMEVMAVDMVADIVVTVCTYFKSITLIRLKNTTHS
jgi:hypothetical protein